MRVGVTQIAMADVNAPADTPPEPDKEEPIARPWIVACERCFQDRKLPYLPTGYWYCEFNTDLTADRCTPTVEKPLRTSKMVALPGAPAPSATLAVDDRHAEEMLAVFPKFKKENVEQEVTLMSGWKAIFRKRKRGDGGDVYLTKEGEPALRSTSDVRRRFGLSFAEVRPAKDKAEAEVES